MQDAYGSASARARAVDLERAAGGNPSWNVGIDYRRQLARSARRSSSATRTATPGSTCVTTCVRLAVAPRIAADPRAVEFMYRYGVPRGRTPAPILTMHTTGDGGASPDQERWYAEQVRRAGDPRRLRQLYVERGQHCSFNAAEEIVALRTLLARIETGRWPDTSPARTNQDAALGDGYRLVLDFGSFTEGPMEPAFTRFSPPPFLRPSR